RLTNNLLQAVEKNLPVLDLRQEGFLQYPDHQLLISSGQRSPGCAQDLVKVAARSEVGNHHARFEYAKRRGGDRMDDNHPVSRWNCEKLVWHRSAPSGL